MSATALDGQLFQFASNPPAASPVFKLKGGLYMVEAIFTSLVTAIELQIQGPDGSTFLSLPTPQKISTSPGILAPVQLPFGYYKFILTGGGSTGTAFYSVAGIPT